MNNIESLEMAEMAGAGEEMMADTAAVTGRVAPKGAAP